MSSPVIKNSRRIVSSSGGSGGGGGGTVTSVNSGTDITVDNTDPANPIVNFTGTYQDPITVVANYSALPAVGTVTGQFYWCSASQGTKWLPGALGGTYYSAGMYYSNGVSWEFLDVPYNATQAEVNTGTNTDKFVTPATLASATTVIPSTGATGDIISFSATDTPSRIADVAAGSYLRSGGVSTLPFWSTLQLPNTGTANYIPYFTSTNVLGESANLKYNNGYLELNRASSDAVFYATLLGVPKGLIGIDGSSFYFSSYNPYALAFYTNAGSKLAMWISSNSSNVGFGHALTTASIHIKAGTATASTAPLKFTSGTSLTSAEAGAMEFTTDDLFFTITTGAARKRLLMADDVGGLTSGRVPFATTNGRLTDDADMTFATDTLTVTKIVGSTSIKAGSVAGYLSSDGSAGATGSFTTTDLKTVTVKDGIITAIV